MATRAVLAELATTFERRTGRALQVESVGGVDAVKRVQAGEAFDVVFLASDAIDKLIVSGLLDATSKADLMRSPVSVAVRTGAQPPDIASGEAVKAAILAAPSISYSTGPSGQYLESLFMRWGISEAVKAKLVVPPPGKPVGSLVASGEVALGFQQRSELIHVQGIALLGDLPADIAYVTTFSAAATTTTTQRSAVTELLQFMNSQKAERAKLAQGMTAI